MYMPIGNTVANVVGISSNDMVTSFAIKGQDDINAVLNAVGTEIRLYEDESCTILTAIYKADKIVRISYEPEKRLVNLTVQATRIPEIEADQIKEDIVRQQATIDEQNARIYEQTSIINNQTNQIATLEDELAAAKILLGIDETETVEEGEEE